ncbi:hypothetical protein LTR53_012008 [Teratosphaeriaceae sp. CCFEE 6253]|nr:hypothetical protein LTR53_012008 [Teratosphaeriaceae sp. CCFEE 6253]
MEGKVAPAALPGTPFLDFLYPPQATASLRHAAGQQREKLRVRRRRPESRAGPSRGFTSRARGQPATEGTQHAQDNDRLSARDQARSEGLARDRMEHLSAAKGSNSAGRYRAVYPREERSHSGNTTSSDLGRMSTTTYNDALPDQDVSAFADSPAELAEAQIGRENGNVPTVIRTEEDGVDAPAGIQQLVPDGPVQAAGTAMQQLRSIVSSMRRVEREDPDKQSASTLRALELYDSLDASSHVDIQLKSQLLRWLSLQSNDSADTRCTELYHSLSLEHRRLEEYQAMLAVFLRRGLHVQAVKLHREALKNISNGDQVAKSFFEYALMAHKWQLAMNIEAQYRLQNVKGVAGQELFWLHVSKTPRLIVKALALAKHVRSLRNAKMYNEQARYFCGRFYAEALTQEFQTMNMAGTDTTFSNTGIPKASIGQLFDELSHTGDDALRIYERMLFLLLHQERPNYRYSQMHRIVSYVYLCLRRVEYRVPESVLMAFLERLTVYWDRLRITRELHHSIRVSTLLDDWQKFHGKVSKLALQHVLSWHASRGRQDHYEHWMQYYKRHYTSYADENTIYLYARRAELPQAQAAMDSAVALTAGHGELPPLICWNTLIHAHARVDVLPNALDILQTMIDKGLRPDEFSFHPIMEMLAKRGDVDGVKDMLAQYDEFAHKRREAAFVGSLLTAHVNRGEMEAAEEALKDALPQVKMGKIRGSLTGSFNIILAGHALGREVDATMRTYQWMKTEGILMDANTYAALMQALTSHRQTDAAYDILRTVMRDERLEPSAFHYALVMTGYVNQGMPESALEVHDAMRARKIKPTFSSNVIYLKARALQERATLRRTGSQGGAELTQTINDLKNALAASNGAHLAAKQPGLGRGLDSSPAGVSATYFSFLVYIHGRQRCLEAVKTLYSDFLHQPQMMGAAGVPSHLQLLAAVMTAYLRAGDYDQVEQYWNLAKEQAEELAKMVPVPRLRPAVESAALEQDLMLLQPRGPDDAQEAGFRTSEQAAPARQSPGGTSNPHGQAKRAVVASNTETPPPKLAFARRHILTRPLRIYIYSLAAQGRTADVLSAVARLFGQGYTLDNRTWNAFIELLCRASPPHVLLAFTLTERFLIPHFSGWAPVPRQGAYNPTPSAKIEGLQFIRARYLQPGQLMPQYRTLVILGAALMWLRSIDAAGRRGGLGRGSMGPMEKYVGTMREVRKQAPKTVAAVQSMPTVDDALQFRWLKRA